MIYKIYFCDCYYKNNIINSIYEIDYDLTPISFKLLIDSLNEVMSLKISENEVDFLILEKYKIIKELSKIMLKSLNILKKIEVNEYDFKISNISC